MCPSSCCHGAHRNATGFGVDGKRVRAGGGTKTQKKEGNEGKKDGDEDEKGKE